VFGTPVQGVAAALDLLRMLTWYGFCLHLYRRTLAPGSGETLFTLLGSIGLLTTAAMVATGRADISGVVSLFTPALFLRLALAIGQMLLLENLYRRTAPERSWHLALACIPLAGIAAYDVVVCADAVLLHTAAPAMVAGRALVAALVTPLLVIAAARNRNWQVDIHVSRSAALHTASLVMSGVFLLALAAVGELARRFDVQLGGWGGLAEIGLLFSGVVTAAVLLTSGSARSVLRGALVDHFFTHRFDYRREWQRCIDTLGGPAAGDQPARADGALPCRVIRALADAVDSPGGLLFTREPGQAGLSWAGAWNVPPAPTLAETLTLTQAILAAEEPLLLADLLPPGETPFDRSFNPWLAVPLQHPGRPGSLLGCILLARPRAGFTLDTEVVDLLRVLAHEVAVHLAQEHAAAALLQTHDLRTYGERFAFVAHDIKNVSNQLQLLLANAEDHLADPAFQRDMLETVRASVSRIGGLIRRLEPAREPAAPAVLDPGPLLARLVAARHQAGWRRLALSAGTSDPGQGLIAMDATAFQAAVTHLLDNAAAAAGPAGSVRVGLRVAAGRIVIDITDDGPGMTPEFIRDELFRPFATRTAGGSGLGAFQARELLRAAGGDITVLSEPGHGTTMRLTLPVTEPPPAALQWANAPVRRLASSGA
jgi:putative PEP-CTERM system histidine kinase